MNTTMWELHTKHNRYNEIGEIKRVVRHTITEEKVVIIDITGAADQNPHLHRAAIILSVAAHETSQLRQWYSLLREAEHKKNAKPYCILEWMLRMAGVVNAARHNYVHIELTRARALRSYSGRLHRRTYSWCNTGNQHGWWSPYNRNSIDYHWMLMGEMINNHL